MSRAKRQAEKAPPRYRFHLARKTRVEVATRAKGATLTVNDAIVFIRARDYSSAIDHRESIVISGT